MKVVVMKVVEAVVEMVVETVVGKEVVKEVVGTVEERDVVNLIFQIYTRDIVDLWVRKCQTDHIVYTHKK